MDNNEFKTHENTCERCGRCCRMKLLWFNGDMKFGDYCQFFDRETGECICYDQRLQIVPYCLTVFDAMVQGGLPPDCAYVKHFPGYKTPLDWSKIEKWAKKNKSEEK